MSSDSPAKSRRLGFGRWITIAIFSLLSVAFLFRMFQFGYKWLSGVKSADQNFKVLTVWTLIYFVVCGAVAMFVYWLPTEEEDSGSAVENAEKAN